MNEKYDKDTVLELLREEVGLRGRLYYYTYAVLKEKGLDYKNIMSEILRRNVHDSINGDEELLDMVKNPDDIVDVFTSDHELLGMSFDQKVIASNEEEGIIRFDHCPYNEAWKDMNLDFETRKELCEIELVDMKSLADVFDGIDFCHSSNCIESDYCELTFRKNKLD